MTEKLTDERIAAFRDDKSALRAVFLDDIRALTTEVLESRAALEAQAARIAELEAENERLGKALADAKAQIMAADACANRHNAAGHLTDRALWSDRAISTIDAALGGNHD